MSNINSEFQTRLLAALDEGSFSREDFEFDQKEKSCLFKIVFAHDTRFNFRVWEQTIRENVAYKEPSRLNPWSEKTVEQRSYLATFAAFAPGQYKFEQKDELDDLEGVFRLLEMWTQAIQGELSHCHLRSQDDNVSNFRESLLTTLGKNIEEPEGYFTEAEVDEITRRFDELVVKLSELEERNEITSSELEKLKKDYKQHSKTASYMPRGMWVSVTSNGIVKTAVNNLKTSEGRAFIFGQIGRLLGG